MIKAPKVFFATIDDDYLGFIAVAILRAVQRKPTTGLFLRPLQCFCTERPIVQPLKRHAFRWLCKLLRLLRVSIIPHDIRPELAEVSHDWIHDPQMWDVWVDGPPVLPDTDLSRRVQAAQAGLKVMIFICGAKLREGFDRFVARAEAEADQPLFASAGRVSPHCEPWACWQRTGLSLMMKS